MRKQDEEKNLELEKLHAELANADNSEEVQKQLKKLSADFQDSLRNIALKLVRLKSDVIKIQDVLEDTEYDDLKADEDRVKASLPQNYATLIDQVISETEGSVSDVNEIATQNQSTIKTLQNERKKTMQEILNLQTKCDDLKTRHDIKTDMVGKLSIKVFVLMAEVEKLYKK